MTESARTEAAPLDSVGRSPRRFVPAIVGAAAFAAGISIALVVPAILASADGDVPPLASPGSSIPRDFPERFFDLPSISDIPVPDLGDRFVQGSVHDISGLSESAQGFGVFIGREAGSGLYCLIVQPKADVSVADCATADTAARQGLRLESAVTVRSFFASDVPYGDTVLTAALTSPGMFSMSFPPIPPGDVAPPPTTGTTLQEWRSEQTDATVDAEIDAHGDGLIVALACVGDGSVTVDTDGYAYLFACTAGKVQHFQNQDNTARGATPVMITPAGKVSWGLTIASTPVIGANHG